MKDFFVGKETTIELVGWHLALLIAFCIGRYVTHLHHHKYHSHKCLRLDCKRRIPPCKK